MVLMWGGHRHVVKSACVRTAQPCLGCQSSRIHHGSIGSVRTHTTVTRAANPTASSKETIQPPLGTAFRSEPNWLKSKNSACHAVKRRASGTRVLPNFNESV